MDVTPSCARAFNIAHQVQSGASSTGDPGGIFLFLPLLSGRGRESRGSQPRRANDASNVQRVLKLAFYEARPNIRGLRAHQGAHVAGM